MSEVCKQLILTSLSGVIKLDPWLSPFADALKRRYAKAHEWINTINATEGSIEEFSRVTSPLYRPYVRLPC